MGRGVAGGARGCRWAKYPASTSQPPPPRDTRQPALPSHALLGGATRGVLRARAAHWRQRHPRRRPPSSRSTTLPHSTSSSSLVV
eukprot:3399104-Pyramimonas_sp.AAC.1